MKSRPITMTGPSPAKILDGLKTQTRRLVNLERLFVTLPAPVRSDWPDRGTVAKPGRYRAKLNQHGAVSIDVGGRELGVKPGEFHFVCPYADGETHLGDYGDGRKAWTITARESRLWVREVWYCDDFTANDFEAARKGYVGKGPSDAEIIEGWRGAMDYRSTHDCHTYEAGCPCRNEDGRSEWRSPRFMPRWASRMSLDVASVRLERLQAMTEEDARAEGIELGKPVLAIVNGERGEVTYFEARTAFAHAWCGLHGAEAWKANPWVWAVTFALVDAEQEAA